jgi:hypothetical protein
LYDPPSLPNIVWRTGYLEVIRVHNHATLKGLAMIATSPRLVCGWNWTKSTILQMLIEMSFPITPPRQGAHKELFPMGKQVVSYASKILAIRLLEAILV